MGIYRAAPWLRGGIELSSPEVIQGLNCSNQGDICSGALSS